MINSRLTAKIIRTLKVPDSAVEINKFNVSTSYLDIYKSSTSTFSTPCLPVRSWPDSSSGQPWHQRRKSQS